MTNIDFRKRMKYLYQPSNKTPVIVDVPAMNFLMIDGHGDPNTTLFFAKATEALYSLAYSIRFAIKKAQNIKYVVPPLEGLWWAEDMTTFSITHKSDWLWTLMIMQPDFVNRHMVDDALTIVNKKKGLPALAEICFEIYHEALSAQILHRGPYAEEAPTIERLHQFILAGNHERYGKHHEIYMSDPRQVAPEKMKTILRQPMK